MQQRVGIRPAALPDAARIAELSGVLGCPVAPDAMVQRLDHLLARAEDVVLVATSPAGAVIGWIHGSERELLESGLRCEILGLVVDARHRARGVGRELVKAVESWAVTHGLRQVAVRSAVTRAESHPFYERLGYVRAKTQHAYRKELADGDGA